LPDGCFFLHKVQTEFFGSKLNQLSTQVAGKATPHRKAMFPRKGKREGKSNDLSGNIEEIRAKNKNVVRKSHFSTF
jgi:hypothetical protein